MAALALAVLALAAGSVWAATITGTARNDTLRGGAGTDTISGKGGDDKLFGAGGSDVLVGGPGNDLLVGGAGADTLRCGPGRDTARRDVPDNRDRGPAALANYWRSITSGKTWQAAIEGEFGRSIDVFYAEFENYRRTL